MASRGRGHPEIGPLYARMTTPTGELPGALDILENYLLQVNLKYHCT